MVAKGGFTECLTDSAGNRKGIDLLVVSFWQLLEGYQSITMADEQAVSCLLQESDHGRHTRAFESQAGGLKFYEDQRMEPRQSLASPSENSLLEPLHINLDKIDAIELLSRHEIIEGGEWNSGRIGRHIEVHAPGVAWSCLQVGKANLIGHTTMVGEDHSGHFINLDVVLQSGKIRGIRLKTVNLTLFLQMCGESQAVITEVRAHIENHAAGRHTAKKLLDLPAVKIAEPEQAAMNEIGGIEPPPQTSTFDVKLRINCRTEAILQTLMKPPLFWMVGKPDAVE